MTIIQTILFELEKHFVTENLKKVRKMVKKKMFKSEIMYK